jgi:PPOX class probable F420-dependent enzyme
MEKVPQKYQDQLKDETKAYAGLATLMADGSPQLTPIWFTVEGDYFIINTARGRVKDRNMSARKQVALCIIDPKDPYRYLEVRGHIAEITEQGGNDMINKLSHKYGGRDFTFVPGEVRVTYKIAPDHVHASG